MKPERSNATLCDALGLGALRNRAADGLGGLDVAGGFQFAAHVLLQGRRGDQNLVALRREDLRIDVLRRAMHRQAQRGQLLDLYAAPAARGASGCLVWSISCAYFFFASFSEIFSSEYFTPLPL